MLDLERSQVIDLLPVRSADSFAKWLGLHPEVEVIPPSIGPAYMPMEDDRPRLPPFKSPTATTWFPI